MHGSVTRIAAVAAGIFSLFPALVATQDLERSRFIASSDVLSNISMFAYQERRKSDLLLRPTPAIASGEGKATVEYEKGNAEIVVDVRKMPPPVSLGPYTTYVLWTLTPDGRAENKGVLTGPEGDSGSIETQHPASQFTLIVTAEPHFAVSAPSAMIVLYNVADKVRGAETRISTLFESADYAALAPIGFDDRPIELIQAEYAVAIAGAAGAETFAPNHLAAATAKLEAARVAWTSDRNRDRKTAPGLAREAVIAGEDARRAAIVESAEAKRQAAVDAAAAAERERAEAALAAERERAAAAAAEAARTAQAEADAIALAAAREADARARAEARADLLRRLSAVLPTRETERGLVSEVGGVQFATGTAMLNAPARESLARFSGIVASYPELGFRIEGHTDDVGSDAANNELSLRRAVSVRDYLIGYGVPMTRIGVEGYGERRPIADNASVDGRARNRRVEIVISGELLTPGNR